MRSELRESMRRANIVLAVMCPAYAVTAFLLRDAGERANQGLALAYLLFSFGLFLFLDERAERRRKRNQ